MAGLTAVAGCLAFLVYLILIWQPPKPAAVVLVGADYASNLAIPHNVLGWNGLRGIEAVSKVPPRYALFNPASLQLIQGGPIALNLTRQWTDLIEGLGKTARRQSTLMLVLQMHGGSSTKGAYLIPNESAGGREDRLELEHVIETMKQLPADQNKILILEGAQIADDSRLGFLANDFARRLQDMEGAIAAVPNLWVLSGSDVDQNCWSSEGLGQTVLSHFLIQALRGEAAGTDRRLTLAELHTYVLQHVRDWVWNARGALQEPVLLPRQATGQAKGQGRRAATEVYLASVETAPPPVPNRAPSRETLETDWNRYQDLDRLVPHPSVYSPRRWREYRAVVVRHEELLRAGATSDQIAPIEQRLGTLATTLENERFLLKLAESSQNNLVMNVAQGGVIPRPTEEPDGVQRFWNPTANLTPAQVWGELKVGHAVTSAAPVQPYRCQVDDFLISRAHGDSASNLATAAARLRATRESEYPQPAEAHFVNMLDRYLSPVRDTVHPGLWALVNRAIRLRRLAERAAMGIAGDETAYPRSEEVYPWIKTLIERADESRRLGEDRLLSTEEGAWPQADAMFASAAQLYQEASDRAVAVRAALNTRDRILAALPDYSRWLGHRQLEDLPSDARLAGFEETWTQVHLLAEQLMKPPDDAAVKAISAREKAVSAGFQQMLSAFEEQRTSIAQERLPQHAEVAAAAVAVPFADLPLRNLLWDRLDSIQKLDQEVAARSAPASPADEVRSKALSARRQRARIEGLLALSAMGQAWFDRPGYTDDATFDKTRQWIMNPVPATADASDSRWQALDEAGEAIGLRWRQITTEIDEKLFRQDPALVNLRDLKQQILFADGLGRLIDGGAPPVPDSRQEATGIARRERVHDLLLWLADRAWKDHWFDEDPRALKPYYRSIGQRFANDAEKLAIRTPDPDTARVKEMLNGNDHLRIEGPAKLVLTTERQKEVVYKVAAEGDANRIPPGLPVIRPRVNEDLGLEGANKGYRIAPWRTGGETARFTVFSPQIRGAERDASLNRPQFRATKLSIEGVFRGQEFSTDTDVELHPMPDQWVVGPPLPESTAKVALRADEEVVRQFGEGTGSIAIVLDCSGSMKELASDGISKFAHAKQAIVSVLSGVVPRNTTVSLWTFSQLPAGVQLINGEVPLTPLTEKLFEQPEQTISRLREPSKWQADQGQSLLEQLNQLTPCFYTPLVQAMWEAARADLGPEKKGMKTLLVLTDGMDTRFGKNAGFYPEIGAIPAFIPKFNELGVRVNMVFFTSPATSPKEVEQAKTNFEQPLAALNPPGTFVTANDRVQLDRMLSQLLRQELVCKILNPNGTMLGGEPIPVTVPPAQDQWSVPAEPAVYKLSVVADRTYEADVDLRKGDRLLVNLVADASSIRFERALYSTKDYPGRVEQEQAGWRLSNLSAQHEQQGTVGKLTLFSALEKKPPDALRQVYPGLVWFQLEGQNLLRPEELFTTRWRERRSLPAPVWMIDVPRWPENPAGKGMAVPQLSAWWLNPDQKPAADAVYKLNQEAKTGEVKARLPIADDAFVEIESIGIEPHRVEVEPDRWKDDQSCLVVRLAFPRDRPCLVSPSALTGIVPEPTGYEHRFFSRANRYTGIFWPVNQDQLEQLKSLSVISLDRLRALAKKQGTTVTKVGVPDGGARPRPL